MVLSIYILLYVLCTSGAYKCDCNNNDDHDDHEDKEDNGTEHPESVILEICDLWDTDHSSDHNIHSDP